MAKNDFELSYLINEPLIQLLIIRTKQLFGMSFDEENFLVLEGMKHCIKLEFGQDIASADDEKTKAKLMTI